MPSPTLLRTIVLAWGVAHASWAQEPRHWVVEERGDRGEAVAIRMSKEGFSSFEAALASVGPDVEIEEIYLKHFAAIDELQAEIHAYMEREHPEELRAALRSSGNLHNPAVKALGGALVEAIAASDYVEEIDAILARRGLEIDKVSFEKFMISKGDETPKFVAAVWLTVKRRGAPAAAGPAEEPRSRSAATFFYGDRHEPETAPLFSMAIAMRPIGRHFFPWRSP